MKRIVLISMLLAVMTAGTGWAQYRGTLLISGNPAGTSCWEPGPGFSQINIVLANNPGATLVQFSLSFPECVTWTYLGESSGYNTIGSAPDGVTVSFGSCVMSPVHVLTVTVIGLEWTGEGCCYIQVQPDPAVPEGEILYADCSTPTPLVGYLRGGSGLLSDEGPPVIAGHYPPTGSTDQPIDVDLKWSYVLCARCSMCSHDCGVCFGTDPDPPLVASYLDCGPYDPGPLLPGTTYYWKVIVHHSSLGWTTSPVYSFTTEDNTPNEKASWGKIKALYQ